MKFPAYFKEDDECAACIVREGLMIEVDSNDVYTQIITTNALPMIARVIEQMIPCDREEWILRYMDAKEKVKNENIF